MYGVLYAISPEIFPAKDRGTGNALTATATRVFGVIVRIFHFTVHARMLTGSRPRSLRCMQTLPRRCPCTSLARSFCSLRFLRC
jgi:hypothetical protein